MIYQADFKMAELTKNNLVQGQQTLVIVGPEVVDMKQLARSAGRGVLWQFVGAIWMIIIQLGSSIVLARVLFPRDYGIIGLAALAKGMIQLIGSLGTTSGVIAKKDLSQEDLSTAFWIEVATYSFLFVLSFIIAPLVAWFFNTPQLTLVLRVISITFLLTGAGCISGALLRKQLRFGILKIIEGTGFALQFGLAIILAVVFKMEYWSLVFSVVISSFAITCATVIYARWLPSLCFSRESFRYMFRYGIHGLGFSFVLYFQNNIDYLLVGKLLGTTLLGLYEFAYRLPNTLFNRLALPVGQVIFPTLSKVQSSDDKLAGGFLKTAKYIAFIVLPLLGGLAVLARPAVAVLWGEKWLPVIFPLQLLCINAAIRSVLSSSMSIFLCLNRPDLQFKYGIFQFLVVLAAVAGFGYFYGINGVALGMVIGTFPWLYMAYAALRMVHYSYGTLVQVLWPPLIATIGCMMVAFGIRILGEYYALPDWAILLWSIPAGALTYFGIILVFFADELREVWRIIRLILGRSPKAISR